MQQLLRDYEGDIKVVYKPFIVHPDTAIVPAVASCAAHQQGKFAEMEALIWTKGFAEKDLSPEKMTALATEAGLDMAKFDADMKGDACIDWVRDSHRLFEQLGVGGTPSFYINGRILVSNTLAIGDFKKLIDEEKVKADAAIAAGTPLASYYQTAVVDAGAKSVE